MRIEFKKPDPRAGQIVRMDSSRGQHFIDTGSAVKLSDSADADAEEAKVASPPVDTAAEQLVAGTAAEVIAALEGVTNVDVLHVALAAEQGGKARKTVLEALGSAIEQAGQAQG